MGRSRFDSGSPHVSNLSKANFFDAGQNPPRQRVLVIDGVKRIEKIPNGQVELWVNAAGSSVWQQIIPPGMPVSQKAMDERRADIRRRYGRWFRRHTCPLEVGELKVDDFPTELQRPCRDHSKGACPHAKHMIEKRQTEHAAARTTRHAAMRRNETERKQVAAEALAETRELNANIKRIVERVADQPTDKKAKGKNDPP